MDRTIIRETRKININDINTKYLSKDDINKYLKCNEKIKEKIKKNKLITPKNKSKTYKRKNINKNVTDDYYFKEWYFNNIDEIDSVFIDLLDIYIKKKVVFTITHDELYALFVKNYYDKIKKYKKKLKFD